MSTSFFSASEAHLFDDLYKTKANVKIDVKEVEINEIVHDLQKQLKDLDVDATAENSVLHLLSTLYSSLQLDKSSDFIQAEGFTIMHDLFPLINHKNTNIQAYSYLNLEYLADHLDHDELVENMMSQLICISWDFDDDMDQCYDIARLSAVYFTLFGKGLEKMTKARDWMLFLPFLSNYVVKTVNIISNILKEHSIFFYSGFNERSFSKWDKAIVLTISNYLDFVNFIHARTVSQEVISFPYSSPDIGLENGDAKRRYLGYYLMNLIYDKIIANFDLQLSDTYYEHHLALFHAHYVRRKEDRPATYNYFKNSNLEPMFEIVQRCMKLSKQYGFLVKDIFHLKTSLTNNKREPQSEEDEVYENDRQVINARLYPLSFGGIATLFSISLFDKLIYPSCFETESIGLLPAEIDAYSISKEYIGMLLNLIARPADLISRTDKGIFSMLYLCTSITTTLTLEDTEKFIANPDKNQPDFPVSAIVMYLSSTASTCPDDSLRFMSFKLIEKFLDFGDDETRFFFLYELIKECPFPSMNTAAIGLLKNYINKARAGKTASLFISPLIVERFFPVIFNFKSCWKENPETFWDDYNYIMEALNLYYFMLKINPSADLFTIRKEENLIQKSYLRPIEQLIQTFEPVKTFTLNHMISLINECF